MGNGEKLNADRRIDSQQEVASGRESVLREENMSLELDRDSRSVEEILNDDTAKRVLPYLSFGKVSDGEKADLISLAERTLESINNKTYPENHIVAYELLLDLITNMSGGYKKERRQDGKEIEVLTDKIEEANEQNVLITSELNVPGLPSFQIQSVIGNISNLIPEGRK